MMAELAEGELAPQARKFSIFIGSLKCRSNGGASMATLNPLALSLPGAPIASLDVVDIRPNWKCVRAAHPA